MIYFSETWISGATRELYEETGECYILYCMAHSYVNSFITKTLFNTIVLYFGCKQSLALRIHYFCCCCGLPTPLTLDSGGGGI